MLFIVKAGPGQLFSSAMASEPKPGSDSPLLLHLWPVNLLLPPALQLSLPCPPRLLVPPCPLLEPKDSCLCWTLMPDSGTETHDGRLGRLGARLPFGRALRGAQGSMQIDFC